MCGLFATTHRGRLAEPVSGWDIGQGRGRPGRHRWGGAASEGTSRASKPARSRSPTTRSPNLVPTRTAVQHLSQITRSPNLVPTITAVQHLLRTSRWAPARSRRFRGRQPLGVRAARARRRPPCHGPATGRWEGGDWHPEGGPDGKSAGASGPSPCVHEGAGSVESARFSKALRGSHRNAQSAWSDGNFEPRQEQATPTLREQAAAAAAAVAGGPVGPEQGRAAIPPHRAPIQLYRKSNHTLAGCNS